MNGPNEMFTYTYYGMTRDGRMTSGQDRGQHAAEVARNLHRAGFRNAKLIRAGRTVGGVQLNERGQRIWWGER